MPALITNNLHRHLEVSPEAATAALRRLDLLRPLGDALAALGLTDRVSVRRTEVPVPTGGYPASLTLTWQLADTNQAHVIWTLAVAAASEGDSLLSATINAGTDSSPADQHLLAAWPLLQPIIDAHTTRLLNAAAELAEHLEETTLDQASAPLKVAA